MAPSEIASSAHIEDAGSEEIHKPPVRSLGDSSSVSEQFHLRSANRVFAVVALAAALACCVGFDRHRHTTELAQSNPPQPHPTLQQQAQIQLSSVEPPNSELVRRDLGAVISQVSALKNALVALKSDMTHASPPEKSRKMAVPPSISSPERTITGGVVNTNVRFSTTAAAAKQLPSSAKALQPSFYEQQRNGKEDNRLKMVPDRKTMREINAHLKDTTCTWPSCFFRSSLPPGISKEQAPVVAAAMAAASKKKEEAKGRARAQDVKNSEEEEEEEKEAEGREREQLARKQRKEEGAMDAGAQTHAEGGGGQREEGAKKQEAAAKEKEQGAEEKVTPAVAAAEEEKREGEEVRAKLKGLEKEVAHLEQEERGQGGDKRGERGGVEEREKKGGWVAGVEEEEKAGDGRAGVEGKGLLEVNLSAKSSGHGRESAREGSASSVAGEGRRVGEGGEKGAGREDAGERRKAGREGGTERETEGIVAKWSEPGGGSLGAGFVRRLGQGNGQSQLVDSAAIPAASLDVHGSVPYWDAGRAAAAARPSQLLPAQPAFARQSFRQRMEDMVMGAAKGRSKTSSSKRPLKQLAQNLRGIASRSASPGRMLDRTLDAHSWSDNGTVPPWKRKDFSMEKDTSRLLLKGAVRDPLNLNDAFNAADQDRMHKKEASFKQFEGVLHYHPNEY